MFMIDKNTTRAELIAIWNANMNDLVDAFIAAGVDPDMPETTADQIRDVIVNWVMSGDECAAA